MAISERTCQCHDDAEVRRAVAERFEEYRQQRLAIACFNLSFDPGSLSDLEELHQKGAKDFPAHVHRGIQVLGLSPELVKLLLETGELWWNAQLLGTLKSTPIDFQHKEIPALLFSIADKLLERDFHADDVLAVLASYDKHVDHRSRNYS